MRIIILIIRIVIIVTMMMMMRMMWTSADLTVYKCNDFDRKWKTSAILGDWE